MYWALIAFRQGSKRARYKNIRNFAGMPLARHTVKQAMEVFKDSNIIVATDIIENMMPFFIPEIETDAILFHQRKSVSDKQLATEYILEVIKAFPIEINDSIVLLQPTCPCREPIDIENALSIYETQEQPTLVSVCEASNFSRVYTELSDDVGEKFLKYSVTDEDTKVYVRNSSIYIFKVSYFLEFNNIFSDPSALYKMPGFKSIDINTNLDFLIAETIYKNRVGEEVLRWRACSDY